MRLSAALKLLGLRDMPASKDAARAAFAQAARAIHPDHGGGGGDMQALKRARNAVLTEIALLDRVTSCKACGGTGTVSARRPVKCPHCNGEGVVCR